MKSKSLYDAASEWFAYLTEFEYEFDENKISKGKKFKEIVEDLNEDGEDIKILVNNNKQSSNELEDEIYYKFLGFSNVEYPYMGGPEGEVSYYLFKFEIVEE